MKAIFRKTVGRARFLGPAVVVVIALVLISSLAYAFTTSNLRVLQIQEDRFYNYDFLDPVVSSTGVSCPVTMLFYNNAWINKVKGIYALWFPVPGVNDWARLNNGSGWIWDSDKGLKILHNSPDLGMVTVHLRVYAPNPPDYMYNGSWGKYVLGTTHFDQWPSELWFGWNEDAEEYFAKLARDRGYSVYEDWSSFYNYEPYREEDSFHDIFGYPVVYYWENSGRATAVYVP